MSIELDWLATSTLDSLLLREKIVSMIWCKIATQVLSTFKLPHLSRPLTHLPTYR